MSESLRQRIYDNITTLSFMIQRLRIWSRLGLLLYIVLLHHVVFWVFGLPDITTAQTIIVSVITGLATPITAFYIKTGKGLYEQYVSLTYRNKFTEIIDHIGFVLDKLRVFPLAILMYYGFLLYISIAWGMELGTSLSVAQATFISTFAGSASLIFGFFVTTGEVNIKFEKVYVKRNNIESSIVDNKSFEDISKDYDDTLNKH